MNYTFDELSSSEKELLLKTPALITVLVAGSDGDYNNKEIDRAQDVTFWKKIHARPDLQGYYDQVRPRISADIDKLTKEMPGSVNDRFNSLSSELEKLNPVLQKLDHRLAEQLYASWRELAKQTAEISGGVLGYLSIGYNESKVITLPMVNDPRTYRV